MKLEEIFNHTEPLDWQTTGRFEMAAFDLGDSEFQIQIERVPNFEIVIPELKDLKLANVSFFRRDIVDSEKAYSTTKQSKSSIKVYGAVANGLAEKFANYDAFHFAVERRHSNTDEEYQAKRDIYFSMVNSVKRHIPNVRYYEKETNSSLRAILSKVKFSDETTAKTKFVNPVKEAMLACGFDCAYARGL